MKKLIVSLFALSAATLASQTVLAADVSGTATVTTPAVTAPAVSATTPSATVSSDVTGTLKDGTKYTIGSDGMVTVTNADGTKNAAPDGDYTREDGTTFNVKEGKLVTK